MKKKFIKIQNFCIFENGIEFYKQFLYLRNYGKQNKSIRFFYRNQSKLQWSIFSVGLSWNQIKLRTLVINFAKPVSVYYKENDMGECIP